MRLVIPTVACVGFGLAGPVRGQQTIEPDAHPVLLVPGWGGVPDQMDSLRKRFQDAGWDAEHIQVVRFESPNGSSAEHAEEIRVAVDDMLGRTGTGRVDIVAHSMGGLAVRDFLETSDAHRHVGRVVFMGTPHRGTLWALFAWGEGGREMIPGSPFLERLNDAPGIPNDVDVLAIRTPIDHEVVPGSSAMLPEARNLEVCCPTHRGLIDDPRTVAQVLLFLRGGAAAVTMPDETLPLRSEAPDWLRPSH